MAPLPLATGTITASAPASTITLAPRFDIGGVFETVKGGVKTAVNAASDGVDQAKDGIDAINVGPGDQDWSSHSNAVTGSADDGPRGRELQAVDGQGKYPRSDTTVTISPMQIFALWTQYKPLFYAGK